MNNHCVSDKDMDSALEMFAQAVPPDGMAQRVMQRTRISTASPRKPWYLSTLPVLAAMACITFLIATWVAKEQSSRVVFHIEPLPTAAAVEPLAEVRSRSLEALPHTLTNATPKAHLTWVSVNNAVAVPSDRQHMASQEPLGDATNAPSQQAPALPLTNQERLLLAAAQGQASSPQIAGLRRPVWPLRSPGDDEDFRRFFDSQTLPANVGENE